MQIRAKLAIAILLIIGMIPAAKAQTGASIYGQAMTPYGTPASNARIWVCPYTATGTPCTPTSNIYSDPSLSPGDQLTQPYAADQYGNFTVFVDPGMYLVQVQINQTVYYSYTISASNGISNVVWPATGGLVVSNGTNAPVGLAPVNGDCAVGSGGAWTVGTCGTVISLQTNGTPNASQALLNFTNSTDCTWTNPSGGVEQVSCGLNGALQMFAPDPLGTQSVLVPFTVAANSGLGPFCFATSDANSGTVTLTNGGGNLGCETAPGPTATWSAAQLPSYVTAANVTAIYAVGTVGFTGWSAALNLTCFDTSSHYTTLMNGGTIQGTDTGVMKPYSAQLTWATGATIGAISCAANIQANAGGASIPVSMNIANIQLRVYYTGTAPPTSTALNVTSPLYINTAINALGVAAINLGASGDGGVIGLLPQANLAPPTQTTLSGTTAGTAVWSQPQQFSTWKTAAIYLNGYENTTATAQTITLPASFATVGYVVTDGGASCTPGGSGSLTISGSTVTLPASMSAPQTGLCEIRGW